MLLTVTLAVFGLVQGYAQGGTKWEMPPHFVVHSIRITGLDTISPQEQQEIKKSLIGRTFDGPELSFVVERVIQRHGFFKATAGEPQTSVKPGKKGRPQPAEVAVEVHLGRRYKLAEVAFTGAKTFPSAQLRALLPLATGDILDIDAIGIGLSAIRDLFAQRGYLDAVGAPDTQVDDERGTVGLTIDLDEGGQYRVGGVAIIAPKDVADRLYAACPLKPGAVYNPALLPGFFAANRALLPPHWSRQSDFEVSQDSQTRIVVLRVSACPDERSCPGKEY
jgi:outer membrane protein assembly factor BamA